MPGPLCRGAPSPRHHDKDVPLERQLQLGEDDAFVALQQAWERALQVLATQVNRPSFEGWIKPVVPLSLQDGIVTLGTNSRFAKDWLQSKHLKLIRGILASHLGADLDVRIVLMDPEAESAGSPQVAQEAPSPKPADEPLSMPLNDRYTFENFVVGPSNRLAHASALAVAQAPGKAYNPVFIYGGPGLGKTHLMQAIGLYIQASSAGKKVAYVSGETFTYHYVTALREHKTQEFRRKYRNIDVWLVDDIQFIAGKERTEEEFFHTYNALYDTKKQIVLTSDRAPRDLQLDQRLLSRFECGLVTDIAAPDLETRMAILQQKASAEEMLLPDEVVLYIARLIRSNIRALEGALIKLHAYASLTKTPVTPTLAAEVLGGYFGEQEEGLLDTESVQRAVCEKMSVSPTDLRSPVRTRDLVLARQVAMYLARQLTAASLPSIGKAFGGRDHSTVLHACNKVAAMLQHDRRLSALVEELARELRNGRG